MQQDRGAFSMRDPRTRVAFNPDLRATMEAVSAVQAGCEGSLLTPAEVVAAWHRAGNEALSGTEVGGCIGPWCAIVCHEVTVFQWVRIEEGLVGVVVARMPAVAGQALQMPVAQARAGHAPVAWFDEITSMFWPLLDADTFMAITQKAVVATLDKGACWVDPEGGCSPASDPLHARHARLQRLLRSVAPVHESELAGALRQIANTLAGVGAAGIGWRDFKRRWPSIVARYKPELLRMVADGRITVADLLDCNDGGQRYMISCSLWEGPNRLFEESQIVFMLEAPDLMERCARQGADGARLVQLLHEYAADTLHPGSPVTAGWLRVHFDDACGLAFVDEVQSDCMELLRNVKDSSLRAAASQLAAELDGWQLHAFASLRRWSAALGYRAAMHSRESAAASPGMTRSARKWNVYYGSVIRRFHLREAVFPGYPGRICL